jgi:hypothetical protein
VQIVQAPLLTIAAASSPVSVVQGKAATALISLAGNATFAGPVTMTVSGLPSGVTAMWSSNPLALTGESGSATLTLSASSAATMGSSAITITASGDGVAVSRQITVQVAQPPGVQLTLAANSLSMAHAGTCSTTITVTMLGGLSAPVNLKVSTLPAGATAVFSKPSLAAPGSGSGTLTFTGSAAAKVGTTVVTVTASSTSNAVSYSASQLITLALK